MTESDNKRFMDLLIPMSAIYGVEMPQEQILGYWIVLKPNLTIEEFQRAVGIAASTLKFMPKPSELIECVKPSRALLAWGVHQGCQMTVDPFDQLSGPADQRGGSLQGWTARGLSDSR